MSSFALLLVCAQACLIQSVLSQCLSASGLGFSNSFDRGYGLGLADDIGFGARRAAYGAVGAALGAAGAGWGATGFGAAADLAAADGLGAAGFGYPGAYGSLGDGNMYVAGELPVIGNTLVSGAVPILGDVAFSGRVPSAGTVSISGRSGCTCGRGIAY